jgi:predicted GIY-YIG superfamily endonuclease
VTLSRWGSSDTSPYKYFVTQYKSRLNLMDIHEDLADLYKQKRDLKKKLSQIDVKIVKIQRNVTEDVIIKTMSEVLDDDKEFIKWFKERKEKIEKRNTKDIIRNKVKTNTPLSDSESVFLNKPTYLYSLYDKNKIVYIGITKNLYDRIKSHKKTKIFDRYEILKIFGDRFYALREENNLIKEHKPKYNKQSF